MSETRDFIPVGNCVEQDAALFKDPASVELAKRACATCVQLSYCQSQQVAIGALLRQRGEQEPVVAGQVAPREVADLTAIEQFGEVTLRFDRRRWPEDPQRALRSLQQAFRSVQSRPSSNRTLVHPTFDVAAWAQNSLAERDPDILAKVNPETGADVAKEISLHILRHSLRRRPNGARESLERRFAGFDAEAYYPFARAFAVEAAAIAALGIPRPERRASFHSAEFYARYLETGQAQGVPLKRLLRCLELYAASPWRAAIGESGATNQQNWRNRIRQREGPGDIASVAAMIEGQGPAAAEQLQRLLGYHVIAINASGEGPAIRIGDRFSALWPAEQAAIFHTFSLAPLAGTLEDEATVKRELNMDKLPAFVFSTLLPHLDPDLAALETATPDIRKDPHLLLSVLRRELWGGVVQTSPWRGELGAVTQLLASLPPDAQSTWAGRTDHLKQLYFTASRLLARRHQELDAPTFATLFRAYVQDVESLVTEGQLSPQDALQVARMYSPALYQRLFDYLSQNPDVTPGIVGKAFRNTTSSPLQTVRLFERRFTALQAAEGLEAFTKGELKTLAMRGTSVEAARKRQAL